MRILIVEDNERLAESIQDILKQIWFEADICTDGVMGQMQMMEGIYDAVILDVMLPGKDGITILQEARAKGLRVPVLMLTAKSEVEDKVAGLESGADYYLTKPFDKKELLAVVRTVVRRQGEIVADRMRYGNLTLDQADYCLVGPEKRIQLGKKEYEVMRILMMHKEMVVSKETILRKVWGNDSDAVENNVEIYISFLRKKLEFLKADVMIVTMRNFGYHLARKEEGGKG